MEGFQCRAMHQPHVKIFHNWIGIIPHNDCTHNDQTHFQIKALSRKIIYKKKKTNLPHCRFSGFQEGAHKLQLCINFQDQGLKTFLIMNNNKNTNN